jgi:hypothetical protein
MNLLETLNALEEAQRRHDTANRALKEAKRVFSETLTAVAAAEKSFDDAVSTVKAGPDDQTNPPGVFIDC